MLQQLIEKQKRVEQRKLENEEYLHFKYRLKNEEENLKQKEREMKLQRQKKRMEIKKKMVLDKIMRHEEIVALKRQQKEEAIQLKRELEIELSVERSQMRNVVAKSQESKKLAYS